jgi:DNA (cytosine-5)-methyltransferase 1
MRVGTDCSGIEAPIEALNQLRIPVDHKWSCEINPFARMSIMANHKPTHLYEDITKPRPNLPDIDLYVCGFPCQPFSLIGQKKGTTDARSSIMVHCIEVIKKKLPTFFILENVKNFKTVEGGAPFSYLMNELESLGKYSIYADIYNTKDYGIPQNRERLYIIGILTSKQKKQFKVPSKVHHTLALSLEKDILLDRRIHNLPPKVNALKVIRANNLRLTDNNVIACAGYGNYMKDMTPTLTCSTPMYLTKYKRYLTPHECLALQGFRSNKFKQVVSNSQLFRQAGNSMSVNVLKAILKEMIKTTSR